MTGRPGAANGAVRLASRRPFVSFVVCLSVLGLLAAACTPPERRSGGAVVRASTTYEKYLPAAQNGDPIFQNLIGFMHFFGEGAPINPEYAHYWFHLAADSGYAPAQRNLAVMHRLGLGTAKNLAEARRYAAVGGIADLEQLVRTMPPALRSGNPPTGQARTTASQTPGPGEAAYATFCAGCHGLNGISAFVDSPSFALGERMEKQDEALLHSLRSGKGAMPGWGDIFTEARLGEVLGFVRGLQANYEHGIARGVRRAPNLYYLFGPMRDDPRAYQGAQEN